MELTLDLRQTARQNLSEKYAALRKLKEKKAGLLTAMEETKKGIRALEQEPAPEAGEKAEKTKKGARASSRARSSAPFQKSPHWHGRYLTFGTSGGRRAVAGHDARENDELYVKHLGPGDLFFHADIQGAPAVILKDGQNANEQEKKEAAQWAASYSSAWKVGAGAVDVYAAKPEQVSKNASGGFVGRGAFAIGGGREWFRKTPLQLRLGWTGEGLAALPACHPQALQKQIFLTPGDAPKEEAVKILAKKLGAVAERIAPLLPAGKFDIRP